MQAIVGGGRDEMWDSKASAEGISWMVDMFLFGLYPVSRWSGDVGEDVRKI